MPKNPTNEVTYLQASDDFLDMPQLLERIGISRQRLYQLIKEFGEPPSFKLKGRLFFPRDAVMTWWERVRMRQNPRADMPKIRAELAALAANYGALPKTEPSTK